MSAASLSQLCELITDGTHYTPPDIGAGVPFLTVKDMSPSGLDFDGCSRISPEEFQKAKAQNSAPTRGDILFSKDGTVGKVHVVAEETDFAVLSSIAILRPNPAVLDSGFAAHYLRSPEALAAASQRKTGSALTRIILRDLKQLRLPVPPLSEQKRIAAILDQADELRCKRQRAIDRLNQLGQAIFHEMFGHKLNALQSLQNCLADVCHKITDGTHHSPDIQVAGIPYVTAKHLRPDGLDFFSNPWFVSKDDHDSIFSRCNPEKGDVLYIKDGATTGIAAINKYEFPFSMLSSLALMKVNRGLCTPEYLCSWLNNPIVKKYMTDSMSGAGITRLTLAKIKSAKFFIPKMEDQEKFARTFSRIESQRNVLNEGLAESEKLFASLQHRAFQGEL